jgi:hypothetical protein
VNAREELPAREYAQACPRVFLQTLSGLKAPSAGFRAGEALTAQTSGVPAAQFGAPS